MKMIAAVYAAAVLVTASCEQRPEPEAASAVDSAAVLTGEAVPIPAAEVQPTGSPQSPLVPADVDSDRGMRTPPSSDGLTALAAALGVPVEGVLRSDLRDTYTEARGERVHEALDILSPRGTPVLSAADGRLLRLFDSTPGGLMVYATDATEQFILLYGHLDAYAAGLTEGAALTRGQVIGYVGTTGNAPEGTPHLHFGILRGGPAVSWFEGTAVNPYLLLAGTGAGTVR